jgi:hypothetical protein
VPLDKAGGISDDTRIRAAIPTLKYLLDNGAKVLLTSHLVRKSIATLAAIVFVPSGGVARGRIGATLALVILTLNRASARLAPRRAAPRARTRRRTRRSSP